MQLDITQLIEMNNLINFINQVTQKGLPISINDEVAYKSIIATAIITGIVTFISTLIATKSTSKNTMKLFEEQEKIKRREDLRIRFFDEYEMKYIKLQELVGEFVKERHYGLQGFISYKNEEATLDMSSLKYIEDVIEDYNSDETKSFKNIVQKLLLELEQIEIFMESRYEITGYKEFKYKEQLKIIKDLNCKLNKFSFINIKCELIKFQDQCESEEAKILIEEYKTIWQSIYLDKDIENIQISMQKINKEIRSEFIGNYFESK